MEAGLEGCHQSGMVFAINVLRSVASTQTHMSNVINTIVSRQLSHFPANRSAQLCPESREF